MATPARFSTKPDVFDGTDFPHWCCKMQSYIMAENYDIWRKVSLPYVIPEAINTDALKTEFENNCKARNILLSGISRSDYDRVAHLETAHEIWNALKNFHQGTNNIKELRRDLFKKEYIKFEVKSGEALDDYLSRFNKILSDLRSVDSSYDVNYPQSDISRHFLNGLDMSIWEMKVTSIQESVNMSTLTLDSLYTKLKTHGMNILSRKVDSKSSALVSSSSSLVIDASSSMPSFLAAFNATSDDQLEQIKEEDLALVANRIARAMNNARNRKRGGPNRCFECGSIDHLRSHCPKLGRGKREDKDGEKTNNNKPNNYKSKGSNQGRKMENLRKAFQQVCAAFEPLSDVDGESGDDDKGKNVSDVCFMVRGESDTEYEDNEALVARKENVWIVDSGCSRHMTGDKNCFSSLKKASKTESIVFANASTSAVVATGLVKVQGEDGRIFEDESDYDHDDENSTSTSTETERGSTSEVAAPLHNQRRHPPEQIIGNIDFAETMRREFEMSMMGELSYFLGLQIKQTPQGTFVHQTKYTKDLLRRFKMENCKQISTPIGSTVVLDPDEDGEAVDQKEYRSMIGSLLYLTASRPDIQFAILWLLSTLKDYGLTFEKVPLFCDNTSAINIAKNPIQHSRTKHIDIRFHFLRDHVEKGDVELQFLDTKLQIADIFTKPLDSNRFAFLRGELGVIHPFGMVTRCLGRVFAVMDRESAWG
ncbi:Os09g0272800 [Oryza sativa Japonica Group]|uniref:Os09g0272800 protein n=1 Tax=Oryza sativa subsp. japonica TaxID=39947 RepID=C7J6P4_ORYSJ|nr:Os09g0272800 [Oryza sativa Japonica Group]|eukprot:NP_001175745.1 Os09g0272800 [Oryza sativa Japonica Group]